MARHLFSIAVPEQLFFLMIFFKCEMILWTKRSYPHRELVNDCSIHHNTIGNYGNATQRLLNYRAIYRLMVTNRKGFTIAYELIFSRECIDWLIQFIVKYLTNQFTYIRFVECLIPEIMNIMYEIHFIVKWIVKYHRNAKM